MHLNNAFYVIGRINKYRHLVASYKWLSQQVQGLFGYDAWGIWHKSEHAIGPQVFSR